MSEHYPADSEAPDEHTEIAYVFTTLDLKIETLNNMFVNGPQSGDLKDHCEYLLAVQHARRDLANVEQYLKDAVAHLMGGKTAVVEDFGVVHRSPRKSRTSWKKDELRMAVMDSRIVDPETGEVKEETPLEKILHVWNLGVPRTTALRERGLDADEFCEVEKKPGFDIRIDA